MGTVAQNFTGDTSALLREYDKLLRAHNKLLESSQKLTQQSKSGQDQALAIGDRVVSQLSSMAMGYMSVSTAISAVNKALEEKRRLSQEALTTQLTVADAEAGAIINLGNVTRQEALKFTQDVKDLTQRSGFPSSVQMFNAAGSTLSATGGSTSQTLGLLEASAPFFRHKPEEMTIFASRMADLNRATGGGDLNETAALMIAIQKQSRAVDLASFKEYAPALMAVRNTDQSGNGLRAVKQGAAAFSALGTIMGDEEGAITKTAIANLSTKLERLYPEKDLIGPDGSVLRKATGLKTFDERLARLQTNPHDQAVFMEGAEDMQKGGFRGPQVPIIRQWISDANSDVAKLYRENLAGLTAKEEEARQVRENLRNATPELQLAGDVARGKATIERLEIGSTLGREAAAREMMSKTLEKTRPRSTLGFMHEMFLGEKAAKWTYESQVQGGMAPEEAAIKALETRYGELRGRRQEADVTPGEREQLTALREVIDLLRSMKDANRAPSTAQAEAGRHREN